MAAATFGGIALGTIMALDLLVTDGFDLGPRPSPSHYTDPFACALADPEWTPPAATVTPIAWTETTMIDASMPVEELEGGRSAPIRRAENLDYVAAPSEEELYREIAALYAAQDARAQAAETAYLEEAPYRDAEPIHDEDAPAVDEESGETPSASETE
jgi:hypothetical protein